MNPALPVASSTASAKLPVLTFLKASMICAGVSLSDDCGSAANELTTKKKATMTPDSRMAKGCFIPAPCSFGYVEPGCSQCTQRTGSHASFEVFEPRGLK